tara:strand:+ start:808 stop:1155 length:348 start_codon:yes stop_codon:yes gene_type:complete
VFSFLIFLIFTQISIANANQEKNYCIEAINENTSFKVTGIYGSPFESELHPSAAYVLIKEMKKFLVLEREYIKKSAQWRFEFSEMKGGKTIVFVYHQKILKSFCKGPNSFFVIRK